MNPGPPHSAPDHTLTQVSTITALLNGAYDGYVSIGELLSHGNFGLGTFDHLDGEMIVLDGEVFQILHNGTVVRPSLEATTPFAAVCDFQPKEHHSLPAGSNFDMFATGEDQLLPTLNMFFAVRIDGCFTRVRARSVPRQQKPYPPLAEVAALQSIFEFENISGTIAGFRCPGYAEGINVPGYHLHFISDDRNCGGHVLEFTVDDAVAATDYDNGLAMMLPEAGLFYEPHADPGQLATLQEIERGTADHAHLALAR
ncbi:MAG: acetolactate decarboxylase [Pseudomonadota bacterium]